jgi:uncharacterized coiled-coil protein SlyX
MSNPLTMSNTTIEFLPSSMYNSLLSEYNKLIAERDGLKKLNNDLLMRIADNDSAIKLQSTTIVELQQTIHELRDQINQLMEENKRLNEQNVQKDQSIQRLNVSVQQLQQDITDMRENKHILMLGFLLQDMNERYQLASNIQGFGRRLYNLRNERNSTAHYLRENESNALKDHKSRLICRHFDQLGKTIVDKVEKKYRCNGVIRSTSQYVDQQLDKTLDRKCLNDDELDELEEFEDQLDVYSGR